MPALAFALVLLAAQSTPATSAATQAGAGERLAPDGPSLIVRDAQHEYVFAAR